MGWYLGFLTLSTRNVFRGSRNGKFYLLILQHEVFLTFSGHNKQAYDIPYTCHTHTHTHTSLSQSVCDGNGSSFAAFFLLLAMFSHRDLGQVTFLPVSVLAPLFSSPVPRCMETVMIFAEPGIEDLASLVPCF